MGIDGVIEPIYFLITSIGFIILSVIQYKKTGKTLETIYLSILSAFFMLISYIAIPYMNQAKDYLKESSFNILHSGSIILTIVTLLMNLSIFFSWKY